MRKTVTIAGVLVIASAGCSYSPLTPGGPSFLRAAVEGAVVETYEGSASFHVGTPGPGRQQFQISSYGGVQTGPSFALTRWDGGRLPVGTYPLALADLDPYLNGHPGIPSGLTLQYFHTDEKHEAQFVAYDGLLEITHSSRTRVQGRFTFSAERYCLRERVRSNPPADPIGPCLPQSSRIADAPVIHVTGSFAATPLRVEVINVWR
jgi:hypothetical protein